jgi:hypothetical protein
MLNRSQMLAIGINHLHPHQGGMTNIKRPDDYLDAKLVNYAHHGMMSLTSRNNL